MSRSNPFLPNQHFIYPLKHQNGEIYAWKVDIQRAEKFTFKCSMRASMAV